MESKIVAGLLRVGETHKKPRFIPLDGNEKITVGRSKDVTVCLLSDMISRCHATLTRLQDGSWAVCDNKSLNGVMVNDEKLKPSLNVVLREGDLVQFGMPPKPDTPPEFVFKYHPEVRMKCHLKRSVDKVDSASSPKKKLRGLPESDDHVSSSQGDPSALTCLINSPCSPYRNKQQDDASRQKMKEFEDKLAEMQKLLHDKEEAEEKMKQQLLDEKEKAGEQVKMVEELRKKEEEMKLQMKEKEKKFEVEKTEISKKIEEIQTNLEEKLKEKEMTLMGQLTAQREALVQEKVVVEEKLQGEMSRVLEEKNKHLHEELLAQKNNLEKVIANKELEQKLLESQLKDTQSENAKQKEATLKAREDVLANFTDLMEMELQCSICNELFIKATSLNCSHSYCQLCISEWMNRKKECPICRAPFVTFTRSIVLDSYIEKMVEQLSDDLIERRKEMIKFRQEEQKKFDAAKNAPSTSKHTQRGRGRNRRGGNRGGNQNRGGQGGAAVSIGGSVGPRGGSVGPRGGAVGPRGGAVGPRGGAVGPRGGAVGPRGGAVGPRGGPAGPRGGPAGARGGPVGPRGGPAVPSGVPVTTSITAPIVVSSDSESTDSMASMNSGSMDDSMDAIDGDLGAYYGGYGHCYVCGSRGHWANGCPFR